MKTTPRLAIPYQEQFEENFYESWKAGVLAIDSALYVAREQRNIILYSDAVFRFSGSTLSWSAAVTIKIWRSSTPRTATLAAGSLVIANGQVAVIQITSGPTADYTLTAVAASVVANDDASFVLCARQDLGSATRAIFCNGVALVGTGRGRVFADPLPSTATYLIKTGETIAVGDVVEPVSGGLRKAASSSTSAVGVALSGGTGDGTTVCTYQTSGFVELVVESGQTTVIGQGVKIGGTANQIRPTVAATYTGSLGIAFEAIVGNGVLTCPVQLRPMGA